MPQLLVGMHPPFPYYKFGVQIGADASALHDFT